MAGIAAFWKDILKGWNTVDDVPEAVLVTSGAAHVFTANSLVSYYWAGAGTTSAPDPSAFSDFVYGVNANGASTGNVYWVINGAWVDTGATVAQLHGGA